MNYQTIPRCDECSDVSKMETGVSYLVYVCHHGKAVIADHARKDLLPTNEAVEFLVNHPGQTFTGVHMPVLSIDDKLSAPLAPFPRTGEREEMSDTPPDWTNSAI